jgi:hypothetical protein
MIKRALLWVLVAGTLAGAALAAAGGARDVLDTPALKSAMASRSLLNGLALAGDRIVAVGQRGHVLLSDDGGRTWKQANVPLSSDLVAVSFPGPKSGWAAGHDGVVLRSTDAGATWSRQLDGRKVGEAMVEYCTREARPGDARQAAGLEEAKKFAAQGAENPFLDVWFENETPASPSAPSDWRCVPVTAARPGSRCCTWWTTRRRCTCTRCAASVARSTSPASRAWC